MASVSAILVAAVAVLPAQSKPAFPSFEEVVKKGEYEKVVSTADGSKSLYTVWKREKDGQMLAELSAFKGKKYFFAMTVAGGEEFAGLQQGDMYVYWRRFDKRMALMMPNTTTISKGDPQSKDSVGRLFTDRVVLDVPIVCMSPNNHPVVDLDELLLGHASTFFYSAWGMNRPLAAIKTAKAFPKNIELAWEVPVSGGQLKTFHWSISEIEGSDGFKPREADARVGYFTTGYRDFGKYNTDDSTTRYITRWHLEPAQSGLDLSPPKQPIVFYIEHTTPIRYRRFVRQGILYWNKAFEQIGIADAIEVRYQDKDTGSHMEKDPEDVRYNFVRWLNNNVSTAIGPSRINPTTGEILDADIVLTDGWIRVFSSQFRDLLPDLAMQNFGPRDLAWLQRHPGWDPRIRFAPPHERIAMVRRLREQAKKPLVGHPVGNKQSARLIGDDEYDGLFSRGRSQCNGMCRASEGKAFDLAVLRMSLSLLRAQRDEEEEDKKENLIDGMPAEFIGPLLADLVAHEVGHTLGLRHNFKASALYDLEKINSAEVKGKKPMAASVMDYLPININMDKKAVQGDLAMIDVGPYDIWAIEYGYTAEDDLEKILARSAERELQYGTDEDTWGNDPLARRYDFAANPIDFAKSQRALIDYHRPRLLEEFVPDGESWAKARQGYELTLGMQMGSISMMANWLGGSHLNRNKKGDQVAGKPAPPPVQPVSAQKQREALQFVIDNSFVDESYGLSRELLEHMAIDQWSDGFSFSFQSPVYPIHDEIMAIQSSALSLLINNGTLAWIFDNEKLVGDDPLTVAEVMRKVLGAAWNELESAPSGRATAGEPRISSLRRNLQREHIARIIDLSLSGDGWDAASKVVASIARMQLRGLHRDIKTYLGTHRDKLDDYTVAHLEDCHAQAGKALNVQFTHQTNESSGGFGALFSFF